MPALRVFWRKRVNIGVAHAVRDCEPKTVCGITVGDDWTAQGVPLRDRTRRCRRCNNVLGVR